MTKYATGSLGEDPIREGFAYVQNNPHGAWAQEIFELAQCEYGRLDYGVRNGRPQAWEINFTPVIAGRGRSRASAEWRELRRFAKEHALHGLRAAFLRLDPGNPAGEPVQVRFPPDLERAAEQERAGLGALERRRRRIDSISAAPVLRRVGPLLRRMLAW